MVSYEVSRSPLKLHPESTMAQITVIIATRYEIDLARTEVIRLFCSAFLPFYRRILIYLYYKVFSSTAQYSHVCCILLIKFVVFFVVVFAGFELVR